MKPLRVYVDTSVIGGCFDAQFAADSLRVMASARAGRIVLLFSDVVIAELAGAPAHVREFVQALPQDAIEHVPLSPEVQALRDAYLRAGIVAPRWRDDATHVAAATFAQADAIVSWNFKHIVRLDKMKAYNSVNVAHGYTALTIVSPKEVRTDEPE